MTDIIIFTIIVWHVIGAFIFFPFVDACDNREADGLNFLSPIWIYKHFEVNFIGCIVLTIFANALCPICTVVYWFYKLCTFGRK